MPRELDPRIVHFQQIKAAEKIRAVEKARKDTKLNPIKEAVSRSNHRVSDKVAEQILEAHIRIRNYTVRLYNRSN
jgi:hypothetical protein